ncbi:hypothetical protein WJX77_006408 [Trebouxia sp. C0004]
MQVKIKRERLQADLLALKHMYGSNLHLKKAASDVTTTPFPILVSSSLDAPASAEVYDISSLKVIVTIRADIDDMDLGKEQVAVDVVSSELPTLLQSSIAHQLHAAWKKHSLNEGSASSLHLDFIFKHVQQNFLALITSMPEFLEPYQTVNTDGATVRRYALVNPDNQVQFDSQAWRAPQRASAKVEQQQQLQTAQTSEFHPASGIIQAAASQDDVATATSRKPTSNASAGIQPAHTSACSLAAASASRLSNDDFPAGIKSAVTYMQRRYINGLNWITSPTNSSSTDAHATSELPETAAKAVCAFDLTMQPTDPAWDAKQLQSLKLQGSMDAEYPKVGSFRLQLHPEQHFLTERACSIMDQLIVGEARQHAGRPGAMQQLVRFVDNRAGMLFHEAEDIVLEASRRRRQQHTQPQTDPRSHAPPPPAAPGSRSAQEASAADCQASSDAASPEASHAQTAAAQEQPNAVASNANALHGKEHDMTADLADDLAADFGGASLNLTPNTAGNSAELHGHDTEETWSDSQWDSSASYTAHEQQTSESDYQHDSFDADDVPHSGGTAATNGDAPDRNAVQLHLQELRLDNVDALEALKLSVQMVCTRCPATSDMAFASDAVSSGSQQGRGGSIQVWAQCSRCHQDWSARLTPRLVHAHSNVLATLCSLGCSPLDLLPSLMAAQCSNCSAAASLRNAQVGVPCSRACSACHTTMSIHFQTAAFITSASSSASLGKTRAQRHRQKAGTGAKAGPDPALVVGQPLPYMGTCKHYHHSHRWLRFPCCGRRFACDLCHEEQTDGHEMKWAQRMVCGYCSTEQALGEQCKHCGKRIARSSRGALGAVTTHWQGGEGCRDKKTMDRRDAAKYRNSKHKSVSKKATRVGKEGAARRQRGQKADK